MVRSISYAVRSYKLSTTNPTPRRKEGVEVCGPAALDSPGSSSRFALRRSHRSLFAREHFSPVPLLWKAGIGPISLAWIEIKKVFDPDFA